ncbi:MAG: hypothetical protein D6731_26105 [Planctomycetota bacterium]|nr:MAG: hypothetical protein D6731_26105 [Planctomycetota bacterium]
MSDEHLRRLERRMAAGESAAAAAWLSERMRQGAIARETLRLASALGVHAAAAALGAPPPSADPHAWIGELGRLGKATATRAALALARAALPRFADVLPRDERPANALEVVEAWLDAPSASPEAEALRVAARLASEAADDAARLAAVEAHADDESAFAAYAASAAAAAAAALTEADWQRALARAADDAGAVLGDERAREVVREALLPAELRGLP